MDAQVALAAFVAFLGVLCLLAMTVILCGGALFIIVSLYREIQEMRR